MHAEYIRIYMLMESARILKWGPQKLFDNVTLGNMLEMYCRNIRVTINSNICNTSRNFYQRTFRRPFALLFYNIG